MPKRAGMLFRRVSKRGQITVFLLVGLLILAVFAGTWFAVSRMQKEELKMQVQLPAILQVKPQITQMVESCLEQELENAVLLVSAQGGYFNLPPRHLGVPFLGSPISLFIPLYNQSSAFPLPEEVEQQLEIALRKFMEPCFAALPASFPHEIKVGKESIVEIQIGGSKVQAAVQRPVEAYVDAAVISLDIFQASLQSPLGELHQSAYSILMNSSCISCIPELLPAGFVLDETYFPLDGRQALLQPNEAQEGVLLIRTISSQEIVYNFAEEVPFKQEPMLFSLPPLLEARVGVPFRFQVEAQQGAVFDSISRVFAIAGDGRIEFTPEEEDRGEHNFTLAAFYNGEIYTEKGVIVIE